MFLLVCLLLIIYILIFYKSRRYLHMLQQNLYNENNRYLKWLFKNNNTFIELDIFLVLLSLVGLILMLDNISVIFNIILIIMIVLSIVVLIHYNNIINKSQNKKPFVVTARIKRLIFTTFIINIIPLIIFIFNHNSTNMIWIILTIISLLVYLNPLIILIAMFINHPVERLVYHYYKSKAMNKLNSMNNLKVIGITGSYGKTSSKNILSEILNVKYNALPTPKNLNTYNGLIMTINNHLDKFNDIFIAEMGAYVRGEIKGLCKLVKPKYGILTKIGTAHLESFGSVENIVKAKFELIESLPKDGIGVLNKDDKKQREYKLKNNVKIIWISIDEDSDYKATNIKCSSSGTSFDVIRKKDKKVFSFKTKLLGRHNVYNLLAGIALGDALGVSMEELIGVVKTIKPVEHRLELKRLNNFYMIDDAYNSNPDGAKSALDVLSMMDGIKIVVTPGIIELGSKEYEYNKEFGQNISGVADYAVLIGEKQTEPIKDGLIESGFDKDKIIVFNDVRDAYTFIQKIVSENKKDVYALFENDLPDTYSEGGV